MGLLIRLSDYVSGCHTNEEGDIIYNEICNDIINGKVVTISFKGMNSVTSSFLNSAFVPLFDIVPFNQVIKHLRIIDSNKFINNMIVRRFQQEKDLVKN